MDYLMIIKIGLYAFILFYALKLTGLIILIINNFIELNKNEVKYRNPLAIKLGERLATFFKTVLYIGVAIAILTYGFN